MTRTEAIEIERKRVNGLPVTEEQIEAATAFLNRNGAHRTPKFRPPPLAREVQERMDAVLCFNLGRAIAQGSKLPSGKVKPAQKPVDEDATDHLFTPNRSDPVGPTFASIWDYAGKAAA